MYLLIFHSKYEDSYFLLKKIPFWEQDHVLSYWDWKVVYSKFYPHLTFFKVEKQSVALVENHLTMASNYLEFI